jgi:hypothetical protein
MAKRFSLLDIQANEGAEFWNKARPTRRLTSLIKRI